MYRKVLLTTTTNKFTKVIAGHPAANSPMKGKESFSPKHGLVIRE
jgi:hypothetical protein